MKNLFFYGSLRDEALLRIVLGTQSAARLIPAQLPDHAVKWAKGHEFPMIVAEPGQSAQGMLVEGLTETDIARLNFYEGGFEYDLVPQQVVTTDGIVPCEVYFPPKGTYTPGSDWSLSDWQRDFGPVSREAAQEVMGYFGRFTAQEIAWRFPMIRRRAASVLTARASRIPATRRTPLTSEDVVVHQRSRDHAGFFALDVLQLQHKRFDGSLSEVVRREVFIGCDAVILLPYDPKTDRVLMVEQFRSGPAGRGDHAPWCLEPVAGLIDPYETPEQAAHREAQEEAGLTLHGLHKISQGYASPGASAEYFFLYVALCDLPEEITGTGGLEEEHEDIRTHVMPLEKALQLSDSGEIAVIPTQMCLNWLARHRDALRGLA